MEFGIEEKALKPSLRRELDMKSITQQAFLEDILCLNGADGCVSSEDFSIDCFLDFSREENEEKEEEEKDSLSVSSKERENDDNISNSSSSLSCDTLLASELAEPVDELKELEWVSHFVDDYVPESSLLYPKQEFYTKNWTEPESKPVLKKRTFLSIPVPAKARTKRFRTVGPVWSLGSPSFSESPSSSSSSSSNNLSSTSSIILVNTIQNMRLFSEPTPKKPKKKSTIQTSELSSTESTFQRRCSHCLVQKTPQWRSGPLGAKTLCNACGVRYKSGRLFPEYRPACSPTFSGVFHSNSHRKVLEMRKKKETVGPEFGFKVFEGFKLGMGQSRFD
ncbi:GATA domain-containing protein [Cephalotus follicularis]|uniref:GATA transcription factor n=1 Tax=Cephalotus follicularis TaxID=3775 RepID=A0A1Q3AX27_CEPFO|nr:GATA domain-containing protein [Cephalotus follicularis]